MDFCELLGQFPYDIAVEDARENTKARFSQKESSHSCLIGEGEKGVAGKLPVDNEDGCMDGAGEKITVGLAGLSGLKKGLEIVRTRLSILLLDRHRYA